MREARAYGQHPVKTNVKGEKMLTGLNRPVIMEAHTRKELASVAGDSEAKKRWDKENMVFVGFKLFRELNGKRNDQDLIDYLQGKSKGEIIKSALREYMENHKEETE